MQFLRKLFWCAVAFREISTEPSPLLLPVSDSGVAHEGSGEEAADPAGEARGSSRQGAARQSEETAQPHTRAR